MAVETALAFQWVNSEMRADTALVAALGSTATIAQDIADSGTVAPYALYNRQGGNDVTNLQAIRLWSSILMQIKAVGPNANYAALVVIADRIDALFKDRRNVGFSSGGILACYREQEVAYPEPKLINGAAWSHLGGLYRIDLMAS